MTVHSGTNTLLGLDPARIAEISSLLGRGGGSSPDTPEMWDGRAAERVADVLGGW